MLVETSAKTAANIAALFMEISKCLGSYQYAGLGNKVVPWLYSHGTSSDHQIVTFGGLLGNFVAHLIQLFSHHHFLYLNTVNLA